MNKAKNETETRHKSADSACYVALFDFDLSVLKLSTSDDFLFTLWVPKSDVIKPCIYSPRGKLMAILKMDSFKGEKHGKYRLHSINGIPDKYFESINDLEWYYTFDPDYSGCKVSKPEISKAT